MATRMRMSRPGRCQVPVLNERDNSWVDFCAHQAGIFFFFFSLFCYFHSDLCMKMPLLLPVLWDLLFVFFFARKGAFI